MNEYRLKRLFDFILVSFALVVSVPLWVVFALVIKIEDRGPIFFVQDRWGKGKMKFPVYKFRTMLPNAIERFGNIQASAHDPRITKVGRLLRATSLDEMPQLLSILFGHMSWVGPRALPIDEIQSRESSELRDEQIPGFDLRMQMRPGLTGIAQVYAHRDVPRRHKFKYDRVYLNNQSLWLDIRLIVLSILFTISARWERRHNK